jgi:hypothetical protein
MAYGVSCKGFSLKQNVADITFGHEQSEDKEEIELKTYFLLYSQRHTNTENEK